MTTHGPQAEARGSALILPITVVTVVLALAGTLMGLTAVRSRAATDRLILEHASRTAEGALALGAVSTRTRLVPLSDLAGSVRAGHAGGMRWAVSIRQNGDLYKVSAAAELLGNYRTVQAILEKPGSLPRRPDGLRGAVISHYGLEMHANLAVDGDNHDFSGSTIPDDPDATFGIATQDAQDAIVNNGELQGSNQPATGDNQVAVDSGILEVGNTTTIPNTPGAALGMPDADLIESARSGGTYFTSEAEFEAWRSGLAGEPAPNTSPIYLNFQMRLQGVCPLNRVSFDPDRTYIVINHLAAGTPPTEPAPGEPPNGIAMTGNVHIDMKGILIMDDPKHVNGNSFVNGSTVSLCGTPGIQQSFGQGGARFNYSHEAIRLALRSALGRSDGPGEARLLSMRHDVPPDDDLYGVLEACGVPTSTMPVADPALSSGWHKP